MCFRPSSGEAREGVHRMVMLRIPILLLSLCCPSLVRGDECVISSFAESTQAPHGRGNLYAPEIVEFRGEVLMYFGGQGKDGHDRIHLASSKEGGAWEQEGVVFAPEGVNHVNDPSVVSVGGKLFMFYTLAGSGVTDAIGLAVSEDGREWSDRGPVLSPSPAPAWDSLLVGRPSAWHDGERFHLWYDGRKDLPPGAPDAEAPKSETSRRFVGYAVSSDGVTWAKREKPVFGEDAGGLHVTRADERFIIYARRSPTYQLVARHFRKLGLASPQLTELGNMEAIKEFSKIGMGIGVIAPWVIRTELDQGQLVSIKPPGDPMQREWGITLRGRGVDMTMIGETFTGICKTISRNLVSTQPDDASHP